MIRVVMGDLITLAQQGAFDVVGHGCNCFCRMKRGVAPLMNAAFGCGDPKHYKLEKKEFVGDIRKLGMIEARDHTIEGKVVTAVNMYTQYHWNEPGPYGMPLDYDALKMCLRKMNHLYRGKHIALPGLIGCGLAGGDADIVIPMIEQELIECGISIVFIDPENIPEILKAREKAREKFEHAMDRFEVYITKTLDGKKNN